MRVSLQRSDLDVAVEDVEQSGELSDHRVPLSHADLRHRHQHLQLHLLPTTRLYGDTAGTNFTALTTTIVTSTGNQIRINHVMVNKKVGHMDRSQI